MKFLCVNIILSVAVFGLSITGCAKSNSQKASSIPSTVSLLSFDQMTTYLDQHKGKPLLINFWATWCDPCVEELPDLIKLYKNHHKDNLQMVGFSVDFPEDINTKVKPFVKSHKIPYPIYVANPDDQDALINHFSKDWSGAVPATFLYDSNGKLLKMKTGKMTSSEMEEFIKPVLTR